MKNFFSKFRIAWRFAQNYHGTILPEGYWTMADARTLSAFLTGDTGTKFRWIMRKRVSDTAQRAIMEMGEHASYKNGVAMGTRSTIAEMDALLDLARTKEGFSLSEEELLDLMEKERVL